MAKTNRPPTILQLCPSHPNDRTCICYALVRTDKGTEVMAVDAKGKLFSLEAKVL